ncbi:FUSC family protein [Salinisphaera sp. Q1T1-3]|uniref:FUSC family protein n=1 Tax=Salinisphaera sp. Q1T1-3 TaxID=2321229 RepID=UPI001313F65A|nr:FUSC family protein [Salinisphaera sp. Q1T1-3]
MPNSIAWLIRPDGHQILFALRLVVAVSTAIYIAMWLELGRPFWSGLEVALMMQLLPGNTVARAAARVGGTLVAGIAALIILGLFRQTPALMIVALACWVSACAFGLQLFRENLSHAFGVVGFITGVIVMFTVSAMSTSTPFDVAQSRVAECCVAAVVVAVVNVLFSTGATARRYYARRAEVLRDVGREMQAVIASAQATTTGCGGSAGDPHPRLARLAQSVLSLEALRPYVRWEHPGFAAFDRVAQRMDRDLLSLTSAFSALHVHIARHGMALDTTPLAELADAAEHLATLAVPPAVLKDDFDRAHAALVAQADAERDRASPHAIDDRVVLGRALELAERTRSVLIRHEILVSEDASRSAQAAPDRPGFSWPTNWPRVLRNSLASLVAILMAGTFWLHFHDQTMSIIMVALGGAIATLFSAGPSPIGSAANFAKGAIVATAASFVINFFWVPMATGFVSYLVLTTPVLFVAGLAMTQPSIALPARITVVVFELTLHTQNTARLDLPTFAQFALGVYGAVTVAMLAFALVVERDPERQLRHQIRDLFRELTRGLHGSRVRFESRVYDRLNQLALLDGRGHHPYGLNQAVLAAINLVLEARRLRVYVRRACLSASLANRAGRVLADVEAALADRRGHEAIIVLRQTLDTLAHDLDAAFIKARPSTSSRRLIGRAAISASVMSSALSDYGEAVQTAARRAPGLVTA